MDRRAFLTVSKEQVKIKNLSFRTQSGLDPYTGAFTTNEIQHLLKRTLFGATLNDINYFKTRTLSEAVDELVNPLSPLPSPPVNEYNSAMVTDPSVPAGQTWINAPTNDGTINSLRRLSFKKWWVGVLLNQDRSIREKMTLFWANHFSTESNDIGNAHWVYAHHALLRQNALGNFRQLTKAVTIDAGMLRYLNGYLNTASAPDENYGRELQELFTIGKDPVAPYSENDVKNAAKVLTGWRINNTTFASYFDPTRHDTSAKQFSAFYNSTTITGKTGSAGATETDELLNMIFSKNEVALFLCRKLYRWFVYYKIDSSAEQNVIQPLADIFRNNNYEIKPVLAALLKSEHFFDAMNQGCLIKSPADLVVSCMRETGVVFPDSTANYLDAYNMWSYLRNWILTMGQDLGDPPSVAGWPAYYQSPAFYELWINSDTLPKRNRFTDTMITTGYTRNGKKIIIDPIALVKTLPDPSDPNRLLNDLLDILFRVPLSLSTRQTIKQQILLSNQVQDHYWSDAWFAYINNPADANNFMTISTRLKSLFQYLLSLAEYQLG